MSCNMAQIVHQNNENQTGVIIISSFVAVRFQAKNRLYIVGLKAGL